MNKGKIFFILVICLIVIVFGALMTNMMVSRSSSFVPPLTILGDVEEVLTVRDLAEIGKPGTTTIDGTVYKTVKLTELINKAKPQGTVKKIFFVASDGFTAVIDADSLERSYVSFSQDNGWLALNPYHPINANAKMIQEIIIVSDPMSSKNRFTVINGKDVLNTTVGKLYSGPLVSYPYFEGQAKVEHDGVTYQSSIFTRRRIFRLDDLVSLDSKARVMLLGEKGAYKPADSKGYYELCGNYINYIQPETREKIEKVRLAVINPPGANITDTYYDSLHYLQNGEDILLVILKGFTWSDYEYALKNGDVPFMEKNAVAAESTGVYPLRANVWQASMLTGLAPSENGVLAGKGNLTVDTLFPQAKKIGKETLLLEPDGVEDDNASGSKDDELYQRLLKSIDGTYGFIVAQFDSIGANSTRYGKRSSQMENSIAQIDSYVNKIAERWRGKIIVTAVPNNSDGEENLLNENLFVPYLFLSGQNHERRGMR